MKDIHSAYYHLLSENDVDLSETEATFTSGVGEQHTDKRLEENNEVNETFSPEDYQKAAEILDKIKSTSSKLYSALVQMILDASPHSSKEIDSAITKFGLKENYNKFKKETSSRARKKQYYEGLKIAENKVKEAKSVMEYLSKLKEELSGELPLEENSFMKKTKDRTLKRIAELYKSYKNS